MSWSADWLSLRFRYLNSRLRDFELQAPDPEDLEPLNEEEIRRDLQRKGGGRFLGFFTRRGLSRLGLQFGIVQELRRRGFKPVLRIVESDPPNQLLRVYDCLEDADHLLIEIAAHREISSPNRKLALPQGSYRFLVIDWMLLQNPRERFSETRPRLPGQQYPGLRIGMEIGQVLMLVAERLAQDGVLTFPNHYHNGALYGRRMLFAQPAYQAQLVALGRDLSSLSLAEQSWAVELGCVLDADGTVFTWPAAEMIHPLSPPLKEYFHGEAYCSRYEAELARRSFRLDWEKYERLRGVL